MAEIIFPSEVLPEIDWENPLTDGLQHLWGIPTGVTGSRINDPTPTSPDFDNFTDMIGGVDLHGFDFTADDEPLTGYVDGFPVSIFSGDIGGETQTIVISANPTLMNQGSTGTITYLFVGFIDDVMKETYLMGQSTDEYLPMQYGNGIYISAGEVYGFRSNNDITKNVKLPITAGYNVIAVTLSGSTVRLGVNGNSISGTCDPTNFEYIFGLGIASKRYNVRSTGLKVLDGAVVYTAVINKLLTESELATLTSELHANPYQLFKTQEDVQDEYALVFDGVDDHVSTYVWTPSTLAFSVEFELTVGSSGADGIAVAQSHSNGFYYRCDADKNWLYYNGLSLGNVINEGALSANTRYHHKFNFYADGSLDFYLDGVEQTNYTHGAGKVTLGTPTDILLINKNYYNTDIGSCKFHYLRLTDVDPTRCHYWEFNQTQGDTVTDHINGAIATLVNFPADSGYVRGVSGAISGYRFPDKNHYGALENAITGTSNNWQLDVILAANDMTSNTSLGIMSHSVNHKSDVSIYTQANGNVVFRVDDGVGTLSLSKDYGSFGDFDTREKHHYRVVCDGTDAYLYVDDMDTPSVTNLGGAGTLGTIDWVFRANADHAHSSTFYQLKFTDNVNPDKSFDFDMTSGDSTKIIDTVGGNHATIVNGSDVKWQRVLPVNVFTLSDFATIDLFNSARNAAPDISELIIESNVAGGSLSNFADGVSLKSTSKSEITSLLTIGTSGLATLNNLNCDDINASTATGDVLITDCEANNVTG